MKVVGAAEDKRKHLEMIQGAITRMSSNSFLFKGWYGLKKGLRGRFGMYMPPLMEALGLAEVEHNPRNNRMRAK